MKWAEKNLMGKELILKDISDKIIDEVCKGGLMSLDNVKGGTGSLAMPRKQELMAAYNRYRKLKI